ncbi:hypothetical protein GGG16DRAFT_104662 [Schizophyllum commune]
MSDPSYWPHPSNTRGNPDVREQPRPAPARPAPPEDFIDWQKWRDPNAPVPENAPWLKYPGSDPPTAEDLRKALFIPPFSPPPEHWRALIPLDPIPDDDGSYTHPINQLPVELLSYIFTRCLDLQASILAHAIIHPNYTSLIISRVCMRWRAVALDTPFLWQHFTMKPCQGRSHYAIARLFLARTKGMGMYIRYAEHPPIGALTERCPCALDLILENASQLAALELDGPSEATAMRLSRVRIGSASLMKRFVVMTNSHSPHISARPARALSAAFLSIGLRRITWELPTFAPENVSWSRLNWLWLKKSPVDQHTLLRIFVSAPSLRDASVEVAIVSGRAKRFSAVHANALESLTIESDGPQDELLRALHAPRLTSITLRPSTSLPDPERFSPGWPLIDIEVLFTFLRRLRGSLERFYMHHGGTAFDEAALIRVIEMPQLSALKLLHVVHPYGDARDAFFDKLTASLDQGRPTLLLPMLERILLCDCSTTDGVISRMLMSRHERGRPLRSVVLGYPDGDRRPHPKDVATFRMLEKLGWRKIFWEEDL